jgi:hypothetical protein
MFVEAAVCPSMEVLPKRVPIMRRYNHQKGFSLVEALTGIVIIAVISTASWMAVSVMTRSGDVAHHQGMAVNLMQKSQEELRQLAVVNFDGMENYQFPVMGPEFSGFTRSVAFFPEGSSTELKRAVVTVGWNDWDGKPRQLESVLLIARPPFPLPGNIAGKVYEMINGVEVLIQDVVIKATFLGPASSETKSVLSLGSFITGTQQNYTLKDGNFYTLPAGLWKLEATHPNYDDYVNSSVAVSSNDEKIIDILMVRKPAGATLTVRLYTLSGAFASFSNQSAIQLYKNGSLIVEQLGGSALTREFSVEDLGASGLTLTVATRLAYRSRLAGDFSCTPGLTQYANGWSSAIDSGIFSVSFPAGVSYTKSVNCANPRNGNAVSDRIHLESGDNIEVSVPLAPVKMATLQGYVKDDAGTPITGANGAHIYVRWHDQVQWVPYPYQFVTDASGWYSIPVPAEQELFPDTVNNYLLALAYGRVDAKQCCDSNGLSWQDSADGDDADTSIWERVGPIKENAVIRKDFVINRVQTVTCGDADGKVINDKIGSSVSPAGVRVTISSNTTTNASGDYIYQCTPPATDDNPDFRSIPVSTYTVTAATATGATAPDLNFYPYSSAGNAQYLPRPGGGIQIIAGALTSYDLIRLWPKGKGNIRVIVQERGTGIAINDIKARLVLFDNKTVIDKLTGADGTNGEAFFADVMETWPPPDLIQRDPGKTYYNFSPQKYRVEVSDSFEIKRYESVVQEIPDSSMDIPDVTPNETVTVLIELDRIGGGL